MPPHSAILSELYRLTCPPPGDAELLRRWVERRDEDAFTALVARHGRMVHGVCRRVHGNAHDAEDAFQAVFLTLARKAATLRHPEALPGWLHGVAVRLASKAHAAAVRHRCAGAAVAASEPTDPHPDPLEALSARELLALIDREIARLPEKYRLPLVLCDLEQRTQAEASCLLGWTLGSFRGRLLRGRERLRARLARRGIAPALLTAAFVQGTAEAAALTAGVSRLAVRFAASPASAEISPVVAALVREGIRGMMLTKLKIVSVVLLAASTLVAGAGLLAWPTPSPQPAEERADNKPPDDDHHVRLWDATNGKELRQFVMPAAEMSVVPGFSSLRFAPDGKTLLTRGADGILRFWDAATGRELRQFSGFAFSPSSFVFAPNKKTLAVVDGGSTIRLLDLASGKDRLPLDGHHGGVCSIGATPDSQTVATIGKDKTLRFWEAATGRELRRRTVSVDISRLSGLRPDGRTYMAVGPDKLSRLYDLASGQEQAILRGHKPFLPFALSPDGKILASSNADKEVRLLDPATGAVRHLLMKVKHFVTGMSFSADGRTLVVWDADRMVTVWDTATGKKRRQFPVPPEPGTSPGFSRIASVAYSAVLSPDGRLLAFGLQNFDRNDKHGSLPVLDTNTGKEVCRFAASKWGAGLMRFSPDSKSLARPHLADSSISLGEIATGRERHRFAGYTGHIISLAFSADGKMLISGSDDTTALVWDLTGRLTLGKKLGKPLSAEELQTYWKTLTADDAAAAYRAVQTLAADPVRSVRYLRTRLHPVAPVDENRLQQWIADLDSKQFAVREKAVSELEKHGAAALHAMRKALEEKPTLETRRRLEQLIEKQEGEEWSRSAENLRTRRALEVLERVGTAEAKDVLTLLAHGAPGAWQTRDARAALQRLAQRRLR